MKASCCNAKHSPAACHLHEWSFAYAADTPVPRSDKRPTKIWNRTGRLKEIPKRVTDAYPLSDQQNRRG
jgi:hypothetical protein